jgi:hypothetical protein
VETEGKRLSNRSGIIVGALVVESVVPKVEPLEDPEEIPTSETMAGALGVGVAKDWGWTAPIRDLDLIGCAGTGVDKSVAGTELSCVVGVVGTMMSMSILLELAVSFPFFAIFVPNPTTCSWSEECARISLHAVGADEPGAGGGVTPASLVSDVAVTDNEVSLDRYE